MTRSAIAHWKGNGKDGNGTLSTQSTVLNNTTYSYVTRFENGVGTNPEELIAAAHAGCFTMKLSFVLAEKGFTAEALKTECKITLDKGSITESLLVLEATVPGISDADFDACTKEAKENCPVSKLLNTKILLEAKLV